MWEFSSAFSTIKILFLIKIQTILSRNCILKELQTEIENLENILQLFSQMQECIWHVSQRNVFIENKKENASN